MSKLAVSASSATILGTCSAAPGLRVDFGHHVLHADAAASPASFTLADTDQSDAVPVPIPAVGALQDQTGYACGGGDCRLIVIDDVNKKLFEAYNANLSGASWSADVLAEWNLTKSYGPNGRGTNCASSDSDGLPVAAGLIGLREARPP
ncbi:MAG TPA: hypothetical protein VLT33_41380 [Labilithrix sp.]|nr:hypothetical protein [Labilithrix sp.]